MTNQASNDFDQDDEALFELFQPLREIEAPDLLGECLQAISTCPKASRAVTQRSQSFPVLLAAIAASLLVGTAFGWTLRGSNKVADESVDAPSNEARTVVAANEVASVVDESSYYAREIYLCGVGRIYSSSGNRILENTDEK